MKNIGDNWLSSDPIFLSDLGRCQPSSNLSTVTRRGFWRTIPYQADELDGIMLVAGTETAAPDVTYPLQLLGWHAISFGVFGGYHEPNQLLVRLSSSDTFTPLRVKRHESTPWHRQYYGEPMWEVFWKMADLTGEEMVLGQEHWQVITADGDGPEVSDEVMVAYIKVVPMSDSEVETYQNDIRRGDTKRLFTHNDAGIHSHSPTTAEEIRRHLEVYRDTDFSRIYWEASYGDKANYFSDIASVRPSVGWEHYDRPGIGEEERSWRILRDKNIDPFEVALDHAHEIGLEFHAGFRVAAFNFPPPYDHFNRGKSFFNNPPELRGTSRSGTHSPRLAYTYSETRRFVVSILREIASYPVDGIALLYNRRLPLVDYEPPLVEGFMAQFGEDPRNLDEREPRWIAYRSGILTQFMREVRQAMDEMSQRAARSERIGVSAIVTNNRNENLYYGIDVEAWVNEGLVDTIIPYSSNPNFNSNEPSWEDVRDAEFWINLTRDTSTELALNIMPRQMTSEDYLNRLEPLYQAGVDHFYFWDGAMERAQSTGTSNVMRRLGHKDDVIEWVAAARPRLAEPTKWLRKLGDWDFSYVSPG